MWPWSDHKCPVTVCLVNYSKNTEEQKKMLFLAITRFFTAGNFIVANVLWHRDAA